MKSLPITFKIIRRFIVEGQVLMKINKINSAPLLHGMKYTEINETDKSIRRI